MAGERYPCERCEMPESNIIHMAADECKYCAAPREHHDYIEPRDLNAGRKEMLDAINEIVLNTPIGEPYAAEEALGRIDAILDAGAER